MNDDDLLMAEVTKAMHTGVIPALSWRKLHLRYSHIEYKIALKLRRMARAHV